MNVADIRGLFPGLKDTIYLNTATMAVGCTPARAAYEAAGAVPLDVVRDGVDFLAAASHKFLLGSRGMGYLFVRRGLLDRIRPILPGWKAARKPLESFYGPAMDLSPTASQLDTSLVLVRRTCRAGGIRDLSPIRDSSPSRSQRPALPAPA